MHVHYNERGDREWMRGEQKSAWDYRGDEVLLPDLRRKLSPGVIAKRETTTWMIEAIGGP